MSKFVFGMCAVFSIVTGCTHDVGSLEVRNGPQAIHPSDWIAAQNGATLAPVSPNIVETSYVAQSDACGASDVQNLVGGPSKAIRGLDIPDSSRHYGSEEGVATDTPSRLNFVHSGTAVESVIDPKSTIVRVFCG